MSGWAPWGGSCTADPIAVRLERQPNPEPEPVNHLGDGGEAEAEAQAKQSANLEH